MYVYLCENKKNCNVTLDESNKIKISHVFEMRGGSLYVN